MTGGNMEDNPVPTYAPGQVVNGHVWTGTQWLAIQAPPPQRKELSVWELLGGILLLLVAVGAGVQGLLWLSGGVDLQQGGNPYAGFLGLAAMVAFAVAVGFGVAGIKMLNKNK